MTNTQAVYPGAVSHVIQAGVSVIALYGPIQSGFITNPASSADQNVNATINYPITVKVPRYGPLNTNVLNTSALNTVGYVYKTEIASGEGPPEVLYYSLFGPAGTIESATTSALYPGETFVIPAGFAGNVWVNAATAGHRFSAVAIQPPTQYPPTPPAASAFPVSGPTGLTNVLPSYLYAQYTDDDNLQAFVGAYNEYGQQFVDWFNSVDLPIYTGLSGGLLDWVAAGLYGITRPVLSYYYPHTIGPLNTWALNTAYFNQSKREGPVSFSYTTDDIFQRIITWHFYKGDGKEFTVRWLKRRVYRFLYGTNGTDAVGPTYQISVTFGVNEQLTITILGGTRKLIGGALFNGFAMNTAALNSVRTNWTNYQVPALARIFKEAVDNGVLEMPFQYNVEVVIPLSNQVV